METELPPPLPLSLPGTWRLPLMELSAVLQAARQEGPVVVFGEWGHGLQKLAAANVQKNVANATLGDWLDFAL